MTKAVNDFAAARYRTLHGLDIRGIRICTVFGHGRVTGMTGMIGGLMMSLPAVGQSVSMDFDPMEASPMIHAEDAAEIFVRAALSDTLNHHISTSAAVSWPPSPTWPTWCGRTSPTPASPPAAGRCLTCIWWTTAA